MHACLRSDLACVYNSQSSCVAVEEMAPLCGTKLHDKLFCMQAWQFL